MTSRGELKLTSCKPNMRLSAQFPGLKKWLLQTALLCAAAAAAFINKPQSGRISFFAEQTNC